MTYVIVRILELSLVPHSCHVRRKLQRETRSTQLPNAPHVGLRDMVHVASVLIFIKKWAPLTVTSRSVSDLSRDQRWPEPGPSTGRPQMFTALGLPHLAFARRTREPRPLT